jgi:methylmalonyl-CoA mutase
VQEDVQGVAVSSYQGGHNEYFQYLVDRLRGPGRRPRAQVFGGGGGVIVPSEIAALHAYGVARIFSPHDGQALGLPDGQRVGRGVRRGPGRPTCPSILDALLGGDHVPWPG